MKSVLDFAAARAAGRPISIVTCYDAWSARLIESSRVDCILVGDSAAMVMHGHGSTIPATPEMIATHVAAVRRGAPEKLVIGDFPFLAHRQGTAHAAAVADLLLKAGAQAVKIEGVRGHEEVIGGLVEAGVPVMGHLGLTPQSLHQLGGFKVQARDADGARSLLEDARTLERLGCFSLVLEAVPGAVAGEVTAALEIPTIGIGAGPETSGQVLVLHDLLGMDASFRPRFVRRYLEGHELIRGALNGFADDVETRRFPAEEETYHATRPNGRGVASAAR